MENNSKDRKNPSFFETPFFAITLVIEPPEKAPVSIAYDHAAAGDLSRGGAKRC